MANREIIEEKSYKTVYREGNVIVKELDHRPRAEGRKYSSDSHGRPQKASHDHADHVCRDADQPKGPAPPV